MQGAQALEIVQWVVQDPIDQHIWVQGIRQAFGTQIGLDVLVNNDATKVFFNYDVSPACIGLHWPGRLRAAIAPALALPQPCWLIQRSRPNPALVLLDATPLYAMPCLRPSYSSRSVLSLCRPAGCANAARSHQAYGTTQLPAPGAPRKAPSKENLLQCPA